MKENYKFALEKLDENFGLAHLDKDKSFNLHTQSFSGTDTCKEKGNTGIVYPFDYADKIDGFVTASSIIDHHNSDRYLLKHTEVRVCNNDENETLLYQKLKRTIPVVIHDNELDRLSEARNSVLFEKVCREDISLKADDDLSIIQMNLLLINAYKDFNPLVIVNEKNLEKKTYQYSNPFSHNKREYVDDNFPLTIDDLEEYRDEFAKIKERVRKQFFNWYDFALYDCFATLEQSVEDFRKDYELTEKKLKADMKKANEMINRQRLFSYGDVEW